jgi:hypothetical protein
LSCCAACGPPRQTSSRQALRSKGGAAVTADGFPPDLLIELSSGGGRGVRERLEHALRVAIQQERRQRALSYQASRGDRRVLLGAVALPLEIVEP